MTTIAIRVDSSNVMGHGHVRRCLSLADEMRRWGDELVFICRRLDGDLIDFIQSKKYIVHVLNNDDAQATIQVLKRIGEVTTLLVDHYGLDSVWQTAMRPYVDRIVVLDDLVNRSHDCDLLIDSSLGRSITGYQHLIPEASFVLLGSSYALLSSEYSKWRVRALKRRRNRKKVERILVSMGGSDPNNATGLVMDALSEIDYSLHVDIAVGAEWPYLNELKHKIEQSHHQIQLHTKLNNLAELMFLADLAIGAGGTTSYERCCLGLPTLILQIAENQTYNVQALSEENAALFLGSAQALSVEEIAKAIQTLLDSHSLRFAMSQAAAVICDGYGVNRVAAYLSTKPVGVFLRPATLDDSDIIFQWQQDSSTRMFARNPEIPSLSEHQQWFEKRLQNPDCLFNMITVDSESVGFLRLDLLEAKEDTYEVSIAISPRHRKKGFASAALHLARKTFPSLNIYAEVHPDNQASHQLFQSAGYVFEETGYVNYREISGVRHGE